MRATWYEQSGPAHEVLVVGEMPVPQPAAGEVRVAIRASGVNPGDVKKRGDAFSLGMPFPRVIPHSDGSGVVDAVGAGVSEAWLGKRVWCFGAQSYRPFGTAAEYTVLPEQNVRELPGRVSFEQGACLGIPGITGHRAVHIAGPLRDRTVLVQGGAGAVGLAAVACAAHAGAQVIATVRREGDDQVALEAGADIILRTDGLSSEDVVQAVRRAAPDGVDHVVEVAFHVNIGTDERVLAPGGSVASYATGNSNPSIPFWPLVFKNATLYFLGSDDFPEEAKQQAAADLTELLAAGWAGYAVAPSFPLDEIAAAHVAVEQGSSSGRVVVEIAAEHI
jgi:NADPH2:quinone reductase